MTEGLVAAVDLGASSGRVMVARVAPDKLQLTEVRRFPNGPLRQPDGLHWDIDGLYREVLAGLREAAKAGDDLVSIGVVRGASITACSTRTGACSRSRSTTAMSAPPA